MTKLTTSQLADQLGQLKAAIAELEDQATLVRNQLIESGETSVEGDLFRASISEAHRKDVNWKAVAEKLKPSRQLVASHTTRKTFPVVRISSRIGQAA